jgi:hypothetical protein
MFILDKNGTAIYPCDRVATYDTDGGLQTGTLQYDLFRGWYVLYDKRIPFTIYNSGTIYKLMEREVKLEPDQQKT